jgi:rubrerythrin
MKDKPIMENIWQIARNMESEGIAFYNKLSKESPSSQLSALFYFLAQQEQDHLELFEKIEKKLEATTKGRKAEPVAVKEAFEQVKPDLSSDSLPESDIEAYRTALTMETKAIEYYTDLLEKSDDEDQKLALRIIINEERNHETMMSEILETMGG